MLKNRAEGVLGPFGDIGQIAGGALTGIGPLIFGVGKLAGVFTTGGEAAGVMSGAMALIPWVAVGIAAVALGVVIFKNWDKITAATAKAWHWIADLTVKVWGAITDLFERFWPVLLVIFTGGLGLLILAFTGHLDSITHAAGAMAGDVVGFFTALPGRIGDGFSSAWGATWSVISGSFTAVAGFVGDRIDDSVGFVTGMPGRLKSGLLGGWHLFSDASAASWRAVSGFVGDRIDDGVGFVTGMPGRLRTGLLAEWHVFTDAIGASWRGATGFVGDRVDEMLGFVSHLPGRLADAGRGMWDWIGDAFKAAINVVIRAWNAIDFGIPGFHIPGTSVSFGGIKDIIPDIPLLARGAIATSPTLAIVGDGPTDEAIVPLPSGWRDSAAFGGDAASIADDRVVEIPLYLNGREIARAIGKPFADEVGRRTGTKSYN
jgi:hypothetical protein